MFRPSRSALLVTTVSLAGLLAAPGAAYAADTVTQLSEAEMVAALKPAAVASAAAAADGWKAAMTVTGDSLSGSGTYVVDPSHGIALDQFRIDGHVDTSYAVAGKGTYRNLGDIRSRAAVRMMGRPAVRYEFTANGSLTLADHLQEGAPAPVAVLTDDVAHAGTKTVHDDGSADYTQEVDEATVTLRISAAETLTGVHVKTDGYVATVTYTYGPQKINLPAAEAVISSATLRNAEAYLDMRAHVKEVAYQGAADTRRAARGQTVKVASLRKIVRRDATRFNTKLQLKIVKVKDISRGVRVYATNPWTHETVSYTVKASRKKVVVAS